MKLNNKVIIITGGTSGIGYQIAKALSVTNTVIVLARDGEKLDALKINHPNIQTFAVDLSEPGNYQNLAKQLLERYPNIDVLINNAASQHTPTFLDSDFDFTSIEREINLNFTSICALSYLLLPALKNGDSVSRIVNINSGLSLAPKTSSAVYCATKAAMNIFSQSLAYQLESTNIRVLQAFLPLVETAMTAGRGTAKMSAQNAAQAIISGIEDDLQVNNIGKVKLLRLLLAIAPPLARSIMRRY